MEKASKKLMLFAFLVIASMVIEGGAIAKVEASRVLPAEAEAVAEAEAEALITTLESTSLESTLPSAIRICPQFCSSDAQCQTPLCRKTTCVLRAGFRTECV